MTDKYPTKGELVVCKVRNIKSYGVFVDLVEYEKEGFVHVSNVASGWVKNLRSHVSEGQVRVAIVVNVDKSKNTIDVSLRKVSPGQEKRRISEWKRNKRAEKMFERVCKNIGEPYLECMEKHGTKIVEEYGDLYSGFEAACIEGKEAFGNIKMPKNLCDALVEASESSITVPKVSIKGTLSLVSYAPDGVDIIRKSIEGAVSEDVHIAYVSAPDYSLKIEAVDYEEAEKLLSNAIESLEKTMGKESEVNFERL